MKSLIKSKAFLIGFLFGFFVFLYVTEIIERKFNIWGGGACFDCAKLTGFPFPYYQQSSFAGSAHFLWIGLIADILIALVFSFVFGLVVRLICSKFSSQSTELN